MINGNDKCYIWKHMLYISFKALHVQPKTKSHSPIKKNKKKM